MSTSDGCTREGPATSVTAVTVTSTWLRQIENRLQSERAGSEPRETRDERHWMRKQTRWKQRCWDRDRLQDNVFAHTSRPCDGGVIERDICLRSRKNTIQELLMVLGGFSCAWCTCS
eukprot:1524730-Rhodomonas_salina.1